MPGLISSSSSSGPKAAPKAAPRRRPGQAPAAASAVTKPVAAIVRDRDEASRPSQEAHPPDSLPVTEAATIVRQDAPLGEPSSRERAGQSENVDDMRRQPNDAATTNDDAETSIISRGRLGLSPSAVKSVSPSHARAEPAISVEQGRGKSVSQQALPEDASHTQTDVESTTRPQESQQSEANIAPQQPDEQSSVPKSNSPKRKRNPQAQAPRARAVKKAKTDTADDEELSQVADADQAVITTEANTQPDTRPTAPKQPSRSRRNTKPASDVTTSTNAEAPAKPPRKPRTRKKKTTDDVDGSENHANQTENAEHIDEPGSSAKKPRRTRKTNKSTAQLDGQASPADDPELHVIDPTQLSMWDLSHDTTNGKMSELGKRMAEIDWDEVARKRRLEESGVQIIPEKAPDEAVAMTIEGHEVVEQLQAEMAEQSRAGGGREDGDIELQMDADGNIIANDEALVRVLNAEAEAAANSAEPVTEENPLTSRINRTTWINANKRDPQDRVPLWRGKSDPWSEEMTDRFYEALRMFGTDFFIISKMFAPKTRRMIKAKFVREERLDPSRITRALLGLESTPMDLEHYARETGQDVSSFTKYEGLEDADAAMREELKPTAEKMTATIEQEVADAEKEAEQAMAKQAEKAARKGRRGKKMAGGTMGGVPDD